MREQARVDRAVGGAKQAGLKPAGRRPDRRRGTRDLLALPRGRQSDQIGMAPGVIADHVAVGEHLPLHGPVRIVDRDVLADLKERRRHMLPGQQADELGGRGFPPRAVIERQRDLALVTGAVEHPIGPRGQAADQPWGVQPHECRRCRKQRRAAGRARRRGDTAGRLDRSEDLPAHRAVAEADAGGKETGGQLPVTRARDGRGDRATGAEPQRRDWHVDELRRARLARTG